MKILFAFENPLPNAEADAEVFVTTARYLGAHLQASWLHAPVSRRNRHVAAGLANMPILRAFAPLKPAVLRHFMCGLTIGLRRPFHQADLVYTRNLWVAWMSILCGQRVVFDHYRPWPDQIPPLQRWLYKLFTHPRFLGSICHSEYTRHKYIELGVPAEKLRCIHNGFEPRRFQAPMALADAKKLIGVAPEAKTVIYTGRVNHKKGLELVIEAARQLPQLTFLFVGSYGEGPVETLARKVPNIIIVPWQTEATLGQYIYAADVLLIPPSLQPLAKFGSTVLPLKLFFYLGSGRAILAGDTPDVTEVLKNDETALLVRPDSLDELVAGLKALTENEPLAARLRAGAAADSQNYTWSARAEKIHATVAGWLAGTAVPKAGLWGPGQAAVWKRESRRWFQHFARTGSVILPPGGTGPRGG
ncbi:glycosyltransferase [Acidocella sp.]|uniref:glycosyltransferase n=1 Tax=Acidocella sp. TaxID=50710 RepID=UPI003D07AE7A